MKKYDYLLVGAGLFNAIIAYLAAKDGKKCLVVEKRNHIGGNVYCEDIEGINVHKYGAHIFHTKNKRIWQFMQSLTEFNHYINSPLAMYNNQLYNMPFNMNTFYQLWKTKTPAEAIAIIESQRLTVDNPRNLEEQALKLVGKDIYEKLIKGYTEKQWGKNAKELPPFIIKRIPLRFSYNNNYFDDPYQGIPIGGYNPIFRKCFASSDILLNTDFVTNSYLREKADKTIYTGMIDEYYDYCFGNLEYRSLRFEEEVLNIHSYQGNAVVNYTDSQIPYTRIIEHKYFEFGEQQKTVISKEYPDSWTKGKEPYYPINTTKNNSLYKQYESIAHKEKNLFFAGRLGEYKYNDMDQTVFNAIELYKKIN
ncbi:UDP-galactopyranose mutase [Dysgonomonas sp. 25]|uniref:UDP-galactopyranose mutase n=1 Tax=Dysgonomonas sp. 25 TaxID=2302933 RepID=UPI0013D0C90F|nr:UDP-galactopyranose mutase [Dysgonomonas sp. 25]NDV67918.1 UDP-galactopyranose mutase [Dysgonomonas sp. 25]